MSRRPYDLRNSDVFGFKIRHGDQARDHLDVVALEHAYKVHKTGKQGNFRVREPHLHETLMETLHSDILFHFCVVLP
jgi:hypothetical protein